MVFPDVSQFSILASDDTEKVVTALSEKSSQLHVRSNIFTEQDFLTLFKQWCSNANVKYHLYYKVPSPKQYVYTATFVCHHSGKKKKHGNLKCPVTITVHIKKSNYHSLRRDKLIETYPCFISLSGVHSHELHSIDSKSKRTTGSPPKEQLHELNFANGKETNQEETPPETFNDNDDNNMDMEDDLGESILQESTTLLKECLTRFKGTDTTAALIQFRKTIQKLKLGNKASFLSALHNFGHRRISS